jgi:hypothetical protein
METIPDHRFRFGARLPGPGSAGRRECGDEKERMQGNSADPNRTEGVSPVSLARRRYPLRRMRWECRSSLRSCGRSANVGKRTGVNPAD